MSLINLQVKPVVKKETHPNHLYHRRIYKLGPKHKEYNPDSTTRYILTKNSRPEFYVALIIGVLSENYASIGVCDKAQIEARIVADEWRWDD